MTCNLTPHPFSSFLYSQPTSSNNSIPSHHHNTTHITDSFMEPASATNTNLLLQLNDAPQLPRLQQTHDQNFQQTTVSTPQEQQDCGSKNCSSSNTLQANHHEVAVSEVHVAEETSIGRGGGGGDVAEVVVQGGSEESCGRERLKRHRVEVAGRVWIPDIWGQEELLKDWIDCNAFDATMVSNGLMSARASLIQEGTRANSGRLRIENRCS